jgi:hypothetical protein
LPATAAASATGSAVNPAQHHTKEQQKEICTQQLQQLTRTSMLNYAWLLATQQVTSCSAVRAVVHLQV